MKNKYRILLWILIGVLVNVFTFTGINARAAIGCSFPFTTIWNPTAARPWVTFTRPTGFLNGRCEFYTGELDPHELSRENWDAEAIWVKCQPNEPNCVNNVRPFKIGDCTTSCPNLSIQGQTLYLTGHSICLTKKEHPEWKCGWVDSSNGWDSQWPIPSSGSNLDVSGWTCEGPGCYAARPQVPSEPEPPAPQEPDPANPEPAVPDPAPQNPSASVTPANWWLIELGKSDRQFTLEIHIRVAATSDYDAHRVCLDSDCHETSATEQTVRINTFNLTNGPHELRIEYRLKSHNGNWANAFVYTETYFINNSAGFGPCDGRSGAYLRSGSDCVVLTISQSDLSVIGWNDRSDLLITPVGDIDVTTFDGVNYSGYQHFVERGRTEVLVGANVSSVRIEPAHLATDDRVPQPTPLPRATHTPIILPSPYPTTVPTSAAFPTALPPTDVPPPTTAAQPTVTPIPPSPETVAAPSNLVVSSNISTGELILAWQDNSNNEDGFHWRIENITYLVIREGNAPANATSFAWFVGCGGIHHVTLWAYKYVQPTSSDAIFSDPIEVRDYNFSCG